MFRMSREADYGFVLLTRIAREVDGGTLTARDLAGEARLTLPMVSKILKRLARAGLLRSHRGVKGGYRLSRPATDISVADVIAALDGPIALTSCIEHSPGDCEREPLCDVRHNWQLINRRVMDTLARISLEEMTGPLDESALGPVGRVISFARGSVPLKRGSL